ncbi:LuxR family transcriptional regulator [Amorphoplanes nipponensis]|uniref:LuxR family transcriptional regulator n=1 Tax=Actinoplanes nipponensis TaxID=135950 RepID=A0A919JR43_9ACTN|nr:LuxR C-terminal-related transcriptional regulator [Actinoplanes nipponensis]GIE53927.1 LuxR family transcriptional regulator [Actinoplanes nipponensis]
MRTARQPRGNLPAELSSFVGRTRERAELKRLLAVSRQVTITGIGGVGKTRTAIRLAAEVRRAFPDGVWLVDLSMLTEAEQVTEAITQALGVQDQTVRPPVDSLAGYLENRRLLLILDTCEHVVEACGGLVERLLRAAPGLQVLATSRQPLGTHGEHVFLLHPLPVSGPDGPPADREQDAAVLLFAERAAAAAPGFAVTAGNRAVVARLCRRLDGIPLGIELAAVRTRALPVERIASLVDEWFADGDHLLHRAGGGRHESLRTAIDGSYALCSPDERAVWARAAVFADGFGLDAVRDICDGTLELVAGLVDKSVLVRDAPAGDRYRMLDTIREYGLEILRATGEEHATRCRHRDFYLRLARRFDDEWHGPDQLAWFERLIREHPNVRAALDFSLADPRERHAGLELAVRLRYFWFACGHPREGRRYLERAAAAASEPAPMLTAALWLCAWLCALQGDLDAALDRLAACRPYAEQQGDVAASGWIAYVTGIVATLRGDPSGALAELEEAVRLHTGQGEPDDGFFVALPGLAVTLAILGDVDRAVAVNDENLRLCANRPELWGRSYADYVRAVIEVTRGDPVAAVERGRAALWAKRQFGDHAGCAMVVDTLASAASAQGDGDRAARLIAVAHRIWENVGRPQMGSPYLSESRGWAERRARELLGDRRFEAVLAEGLAYDPDTGMTYALDEPRPGAGAEPAAAWAPLTRREREVAGLIADGLTNQQIADRLVIGRRTANTHVEHILTKLDFSARAQIAAWVGARRGAADRHRSGDRFAAATGRRG